MKCPHCGNYIENTLWEALKPYRGLSDKVVITNIDTILDVGPRIRAIFEEKNGRLMIRGYQAVTLKKVAKALRVPLYYIERIDERVRLFEFDVYQRVNSGEFLRADQLIPVFSGSVEEFGDWIYQKYILHAPPSSNGRRKERRW